MKSVLLQGCRALVTGGAGLVGSHIVDQLIDVGASDIVVLDNFTRGTRRNLAPALARFPVRIVEGDIRDTALLAQQLDGIDVLFHQAAIRITHCAEQPRLALEVLANGTFNVLEAAVNAKVKKVVSASSASIYGMAREFPTREDHHPYENRTFYGACKTFNEGMLRSFHEMHGLDYVALRYFNVYGPRMDREGVYTEVFIRWMSRIDQGQPPVIFGDGSQTMDFVFIEDIARSNLCAARAEVSDRVYNVASGTETSLQQLADALLAAMGATGLSVEHGPERKVNPVPRRLADPSAAERDLGFRTEVGLDEGLRRLVAWWRS
jgi:UDP-glucose 4-epimerase